MNNLLHILIFVSLIFFSSCKQQEEAVVPVSGNTVKIGVIAPLSGPLAKLGENTILGINTALKLQPFLQNGDAIELVSEDSQGTTEQTITALIKLSQKDNVSGILLMADSNIVLEVAKIADKYKTPIIALNASHPDVTKNNKFIAQLIFDDEFQGTVAALYVMDELLIERVAVFSDPDNLHYSFLAEKFISKYESLDGLIVEHVISKPDNNDYQAILAKLKKQQAQLIYLAVASEQVTHMARSSEKINWYPEAMGTDGLLSAITLQFQKESSLIDGMMATDVFSTILPKTEYGKKVVKLYGKHFSDPGTSYMGLACEGTSILMSAINRCDNKSNTACVNYMLRSTTGFEGLFGKISIHEDGTAERPIFVNIIKNLEANFLVKVY
jgi:branched-chain amino acid transport system substrate-binding protein